MSARNEYIGAAILYQLQILPDSLLMGVAVLAILLANPAVLALALGCAVTQGITFAAGSVLAAAQPSQSVIRSSLDTCTGGYVGRSWGRLFQTSGASGGILSHPYAPSVYLATIGYFAAFGAALSQLYRDEIDAGMIPRRTLMAMGILTAILVLVTIVFRVGNGCESVMSAIGGTVFGFVLGYLMTILFGYISSRRGTNLWGIPLLRDRINSGSAVYVCPS